MNFKLAMLQDEYWWGGAVEDGCKMPLSHKTVYILDYKVNATYNQVNPIWLSNKGRFLYVKGGSRLSVQNGCIEVSGAEDYILESGHRTLKGAFQAVAQKFFKKEEKQIPSVMLTAPQYCTWVDMLRNVSEERVLAYAESIVNGGMKPGVLIIDDGWMKTYGQWEFTSAFVNPKEMVKKLHEMGFKVILWMCPFVSVGAKDYDLLKEKGALCIDKDGKIAMREWWNGTDAVLDGSHPFAFEWLNKTLKNLMQEYGVDGFKFDAGDGMYYEHDDITYAGVTPNEQSRLWAEFANKFEYSELRACYEYGGASIAQRLADKKSVWGEKGLSTLIPNMIQAGLCGYGYCCPDMIGGGNEADFATGSPKDEELFLRSCQCSSLMPMMQFSYSIWRSQNVALKESIKEYSHVRDNYCEYLLSLAEHCRKTNEPILRNLEYVFPNQGLEGISDQFMLGDKILVAPVVEQGARKREVVLPQGCYWKYIPNGHTYEGGQTIVVDAPVEVLPYFTRNI